MPATQTPPRRKWHFTRWAIVVIACIFAWSGWRAYAFRSAMAKARALGWYVHYDDPFKVISKYWRNAFSKRTWLTDVQVTSIRSHEAFEQNIAIIRRLNPTGLGFRNAPSLPSASSLNSISALRAIDLHGMAMNQRNIETLSQITGLRTLSLSEYTGGISPNAFDSLTNLENLQIRRCSGLTTFDSLKSLTKLQNLGFTLCPNLTAVSTPDNPTSLKSIFLYGCSNISQESIAELKAALPNAEITP